METLNGMNFIFV